MPSCQVEWKHVWLMTKLSGLDRNCRRCYHVSPELRWLYSCKHQLCLLPSSLAADKNWRRQHHSSPELQWLCSPKHQLHWQPSSLAADRSCRRWHHSSPELEWLYSHKCKRGRRRHAFTSSVVNLLVLYSPHSTDRLGISLLENSDFFFPGKASHDLSQTYQPTSQFLMLVTVGFLRVFFF